MIPSESWIAPPPPWLVDWSQVAGAAFGVLAFGAATFALLQTKRTAIKERRRQHELEILRHLAELLEVRHNAEQAEELAAKTKIAAQLILLRRDDLPTVRAAISAGVSQSELEDFSASVYDWLLHGGGRFELEKVSKDYPEYDYVDLAQMAANFDRVRWVYVTQHEQLDDKSHIYGYTSNSIAYRELTSAVARRLDRP